MSLTPCVLANQARYEQNRSRSSVPRSMMPFPRDEPLIELLRVRFHLQFARFRKKLCTRPSPSPNSVIHRNNDPPHHDWVHEAIPGCHRHHIRSRTLCRWSPPIASTWLSLWFIAHANLLYWETNQTLYTRTHWRRYPKIFPATVCNESHPQQWKMIRRMLILNMWKRFLPHLFRVHWHVIHMVTLALRLAVFQGTKTRRFFFV